MQGAFYTTMMWMLFGGPYKDSVSAQHNKLQFAVQCSLSAGASSLELCKCKDIPSDLG